MIINTRIIVVLLGVMVLLFSCRNRLKPKMFQVEDDSRLKLEYIDSYYMENFDLIFDADSDPLIPGEGIVLISNQQRPDPENINIKTGLMSAVGEFQFRLYVDLPSNITTGSLDLKKKSICRIIGRFDLEDRIKHYECREGQLKIDTVKSSRFHAHLYGKYFNYKNDSLVFDGTLNVTRKK